jgi:hypothetical protein
MTEPTVAELSAELIRMADELALWPREQEKLRLAAQRLAEMSKAHVKALEEATIAWSCCASLHREFAKGKDALYTRRQADFVRHEESARASLKAALQEDLPN